MDHGGDYDHLGLFIALLILPWFWALHLIHGNKISMLWVLESRWGVVLNGG